MPGVVTTHLRIAWRAFKLHRRVLILSVLWQVGCHIDRLLDSDSPRGRRATDHLTWYVIRPCHRRW